VAAVDSAGCSASSLLRLLLCAQALLPVSSRRHTHGAALLHHRSLNLLLNLPLQVQMLIRTSAGQGLCRRRAPQFPGKVLAYNCSPSFNWAKHLKDQEIATFQQARSPD
jgi:Isocitrate lyase family